MGILNILTAFVTLGASSKISFESFRLKDSHNNNKFSAFHEIIVPCEKSDMLKSFVFFLDDGFFLDGCE